MYCVIRYSLHVNECNESNVSKNSSQIRTDVNVNDNKELLINPNCYVQILIEYIINEIDLQMNPFDLCDNDGQLKKINTYPPNTYATDILNYRDIYYVVMCECIAQYSILLIDNIIIKTLI